MHTLVQLLQLFETLTSWELDEALKMWSPIFTDLKLVDHVVEDKAPDSFVIFPPWVVQRKTPILNRSSLSGHDLKSG